MARPLQGVTWTATQIGLVDLWPFHLGTSAECQPWHGQPSCRCRCSCDFSLSSYGTDWKLNSVTFDDLEWLWSRDAIGQFCFHVSLYVCSCRLMNNDQIRHSKVLNHSVEGRMVWVSHTLNQRERNPSVSKFLGLLTIPVHTVLSTEIKLSSPSIAKMHVSRSTMSLQLKKSN